ncbi:MAG: zinc dependent phospholipase C family protein [Crocinitomicaceae bacterium]|nr:zinc dependent phospholipase C family protein [Crocinitomicaceae bacterium]
MGNWLNYKYLLVFTLPLFLAMGSNKESQKIWGFFGHKRINRIAVFTLPQEMFGFYKDHIEYLTEHAVDPDKRRYAVEGEAQCHYIDLDHYYKPGEDPFTIMPRRWYDAVAKFTEDTLQTYGIVPWHINVMKLKLQKAFETKNVDLILKYSADIGHYIGDAHVPLHTTENYNGQMTGQRGIHGLWESRLVEVNAEDYDYFVGKGKYVKSIVDFAWEAVEKSHLALDSVLRIEKELTAEFPSDKKYSYEQRGNTTISVYSYDFSQEYHKRMNGMVERRMRAAIIAVGSIWYTAWVDAGQPDLSALQNVQPSAELLEEMRQLEEHFHNEKHKGRICE